MLIVHGDVSESCFHFKSMYNIWHHLSRLFDLAFWDCHWIPETGQKLAAVTLTAYFSRHTVWTCYKGRDCLQNWICSATSPTAVHPQWIANCSWSEQWWGSRQTQAGHIAISSSDSRHRKLLSGFWHAAVSLTWANADMLIRSQESWQQRKRPTAEIVSLLTHWI